MPARAELLKDGLASARAEAFMRHRGGEDVRRVVEGLSDAMDSLLRPLLQDLAANANTEMAVFAVAGYGRREICPQSDLALLFLVDSPEGAGGVEPLAGLLRKAGLPIVHSASRPEECLAAMQEEAVTAAALLEARHLSGSERLLRRFQGILSRFVKSPEAFVAAGLESLRESLAGPNRTIFVTEPHLKEGTACLWDLQRIRWIERMRRGAVDAKIEDLSSQGDHALDQVRRLTEAYDFYLRVRCELHFVERLAQDLLTQESQGEVARGLGYPEPSAQRLLEDYHRHSFAVLTFARQYLETAGQGRRFLSKLRSRFFSSRVSPFLSLLDGRLYLAAEPPGPGEQVPAQILSVFTAAQSRNAELSESLAAWIRARTADASLDFARSPEVEPLFLELLAGGRNVGRLLTRMHETGVLARIIPEFGPLSGLVKLDGHHQFTVDEQTLRALRELDRVEADAGHPEREIVELLAAIPDRLPLRLALLLRNLGMAAAGGGGAGEAPPAVLICERLGLDAETIQTVEHLLYHRFLMLKYSERTDFTVDQVVESFARLMENPERLALHYLFSYFELHSMGQGVWTAWKGAQLYDLYQRTLIVLKTGSLPAGGNLEEALAAAGIEGERARKVLDHCALMENQAYCRETIPERMAYHLDLVEKHLASGAMQVGLDVQVGHSEITFCGSDRPGLFADLTGVLLSEGLDILGARIFSRQDRVAIDVFQVEVADRLPVAMAQRVESLRRKIDRIGRNEVSVEDLIAERARRHPFPGRAASPLPPKVTFDNELSPNCTVIEVDAPDRTGLLHALASTLSALGLDLRAARVSTLIDRAHDAFYVVLPGAGKVLDGATQEKTSKALLASILRPLGEASPGSETAG
jgi:[protein-PII] uridylyltransferase